MPKVLKSNRVADRAGGGTFRVLSGVVGVRGVDEDGASQVTIYRPEDGDFDCEKPLDVMFQNKVERVGAAKVAKPRDYDKTFQNESDMDAPFAVRKKKAELAAKKDAKVRRRMKEEDEDVEDEDVSDDVTDFDESKPTHKQHPQATEARKRRGVYGDKARMPGQKKTQGGEEDLEDEDKEEEEEEDESPAAKLAAKKAKNKSPKVKKSKK